MDQLFLLYLALPIQVIERDDVVFTNASANTSVPPDFLSAPDDLENLNWACIDSQKWSMPSDLEKQARMAEVLLHCRVDISDVHHITVWNDEIKKEVERILADAGLRPPPIWFDGHDGKHHYFMEQGMRCPIAKFQRRGTDRPNMVHLPEKTFPRSAAQRNGL